MPARTSRTGVSSFSVIVPPTDASARAGEGRGQSTGRENASWARSPAVKLRCDKSRSVNAHGRVSSAPFRTVRSRYGVVDRFNVTRSGRCEESGRGRSDTADQERSSTRRFDKACVGGLGFVDVVESAVSRTSRVRKSEIRRHPFNRRERRCAGPFPGLPPLPPPAPPIDKAIKSSSPTLENDKSRLVNRSGEQTGNSFASVGAGNDLRLRCRVPGRREGNSWTRSAWLDNGRWDRDTLW